MAAAGVARAIPKEFASCTAYGAGVRVLLPCACFCFACKVKCGLVAMYVAKLVLGELQIIVDYVTGVCVPLSISEPEHFAETTC